LKGSGEVEVVFKDLGIWDLEGMKGLGGELEVGFWGDIEGRFLVGFGRRIFGGIWNGLEGFFGFSWDLSGDLDYSGY
jgi:hypothetical protein